MKPFISHPNVSCEGLVRLQRFLEDNYNKELHDIYDKINDDMKSREEIIDKLFDEIGM